MQVAGWLTFCKLAAAPLGRGLLPRLIVFPVETFGGAVMIAAGVPAGGGECLHPCGQHYAGPRRRRVSGLVS